MGHVLRSLQFGNAVSDQPNRPRKISW